MDALVDERRRTNPVFNDRKLKLGTFGTNLDRGCAISSIDGVLEINWPKLPKRWNSKRWCRSGAGTALAG